MSKIEKVFTKLKEKKEGALIGYVTGGDPKPEITPLIADALIDGGVDILELGIPYYDIHNPKTEIVLVNSAAGIMIGGKADDFISAMEIARKSISSGAAYKKLKELIQKSNGNISKIEELEASYG